MTSEPLHVTDQEFEKIVLENELPVIVDFWAPWCGPCRMVGPILEKFAKEYEGKIVVVKVNTDENQLWASKYHVRGIPTMLFVHNGEVVKQQVGALPEPMLRQAVEQLLESIPVA